MHAAERAGLATIPAIIRELTDDDATIVMVEANSQREEILPSEKAFAYKMRYEAIRRSTGRKSKDELSAEKKCVPTWDTKKIGQSVRGRIRGK